MATSPSEPRARRMVPRMRPEDAGDSWRPASIERPARLWASLSGRARRSLAEGNLHDVSSMSTPTTPSNPTSSTSSTTKKTTPETEADGRARGEEAGGGQSGNDILEDGQLRGVDEDGNITGGTHGGPKKHKEAPGT